MSNLLPLNEILAQLDGHKLKNDEAIQALAARVLDCSRKINDSFDQLKLSILNFENMSGEVNAQINGLNTRIDEMLSPK